MDLNCSVNRLRTHLPRTRSLVPGRPLDLSLSSIATWLHSTTPDFTFIRSPQTSLLMSLVLPSSLYSLNFPAPSSTPLFSHSHLTRLSYSAVIFVGSGMKYKSSAGTTMFHELLEISVCERNYSVGHRFFGLIIDSRISIHFSGCGLFQ